MVRKKADLIIAARNVARSTGTGRTIIEHARLLSELGLKVVVVGEALDIQNIKASAAQYGHTIKLPFGKWARRMAFSYQVDRYRAWYRPTLVWGHGDNLNQNILSLHNCVHLAHEVMALHGGSSLPSVARLHEIQLRTKQFSLLIANSNLMRRDLVGRFQVDANKIVTVHPGYDPMQFNTNNREANRKLMREEWRVGQTEFLAALVTSGDFKKRNVVGCLHAVAEILRQGKKMKLVIIGKHTSDNQVQQFIDRIGIRQDVILLQPRSDIEKVFHAADLCIHPAHIEEFGQVVQESIMCGTPVLTSRMVGATDLFPEGSEVLVLQKPDHEGLVKGLMLFQSNTEYRLSHALKTQTTMLHNTWDFNFRSTIAAILGKFGDVIPAALPNDRRLMY